MVTLVLGNAINRASQSRLSKSTTRTIDAADGEDPLLATGGLYAPIMRHHRGVTYIACTNVIHESRDDTNPSFENFIISTNYIHSSDWSDPTYFDFHGIDPDMFFDDDGRTYIVRSSYTQAPPRGTKFPSIASRLICSPGKGSHLKGRYERASVRLCQKVPTSISVVRGTTS